MEIMSEAIDYQKEVRRVYPQAYICYNNIFEKYCLYENHKCENRISEKHDRIYEIWHSAYERLTPSIESK